MEAQPTCGIWRKQINRGIGAEPAEAFDNAKQIARHSFAVLFPTSNKPGWSAIAKLESVKKLHSLQYRPFS